MDGGTRNILIVGGGTAGWLCAAYLAKALALRDNPHLTITLLESPEIGIIGVGEGTFPTIRETLRFLDIDERKFIRESSATFKQGILFTDWLHEPSSGKRHRFFTRSRLHFIPKTPASCPIGCYRRPTRGRRSPTRSPSKTALLEQSAGPKRLGEPDFDGPLNYAYHIDARNLARLLGERARQLGVVHLTGELEHAELGGDGAIERVVLKDGKEVRADLYVDCSGFHAELIGRALNSPFRSVREYLFANKAAVCKISYNDPEAPIESYTLANAHEAGWTWDIGLADARGIGCVYSSDHMGDERALATLSGYVGPGFDESSVRILSFDTGYRERQWVTNCVAIGLSAGFLEPLEATGLVLIEAAVGMLAELFPHQGPVDAPAHRFNQLMAARFENIVKFLKLHYCLSQRAEPFWRENADPATIPDELQELLRQWRYRPPGRFDFILDVETFAFFNYQYILYGMEFPTDLSPGRCDFPNVAAARKLFDRIRVFGEKAARDLPSHRDLVSELAAA